MLHRNKASGDDNHLYDAALTEIEDLLKQLRLESADRVLTEALKKVESFVSPIHAELVERIEALQTNARWDTFTVAFYGETNAGKSTTIETLRILLGEKTKLDTQRKFHAMQTERGLSEAALTDLDAAIDHDTKQVEALRLKAIETSAQLDGEEAEALRHLSLLREDIEEKKRTRSIWRKLIHVFRKMPEELTFALAQQSHEILVSAHASARSVHAADIEAARTSLQSKIEARQNSFADLASLAPFADGYIVGNGRSDFTRETHPYDFEVNGQRFEVLDVPGIEGKETDVIKSILTAVTTAHAVFYVTGKAAPPQTGDQSGQGTLEKIKMHLRDHTEVWSIFNKRITNPVMLEKDELLSADEQGGLSALDETMREHLGEQYRGCIALSAQPAFLAAAECLTPRSDLTRARSKLLSRFSVEDVISKTAFRAFVDRLTGSMIAGAEDRMRLANVNKLHHAIHSASSELGKRHEELIRPLAEGLKKDWKYVDQQLDLSVAGLDHIIQNTALDAVSTFESSVRNTMYQKIEDGLKNDELKNTLIALLQSEQATLESRLKDQVGEKLEDFQQEVDKILTRFHQRAKDLQRAYGSMSGRGLGHDFEFDMKFDSGVQYVALISAIAGALMMIWNPVGWVSMAIGGLTIIVSIAKAVWGLFDEDFRKGQQRKATDENLGRVIDSMRQGVLANCAVLRQHVDEQIDAIKAEVKFTVDQAAEVSASLANLCASLGRFEKKIASEKIKTDDKDPMKNLTKTGVTA